MYSIRPHTSEIIQFDLPKTMYSIQPIIQPIKQSVNPSVLKDIEQRQNSLLEKIQSLNNQLVLYLNSQNQGKITSVPAVPFREDLVVHLSAKQPSKDILNLIENFHDKLSIRMYRHSSLRDVSFKNPIQHLSTSTTQNKPHTLTVIWADGDDLPNMFHSSKKINDEKSIVNLISAQLTNKD